MRLGQKVTRQPSSRQALGGALVLYGAVAIFLFTEVGGSATAMWVTAALIFAFAALVFFAPTETMDARWFHVLPVGISILAAMTMIATAPNGGPSVFIYAYIGSLTAVVAETRRGLAGQLAFALVAMSAALAIGGATTVTLLACLIVAPVMLGLGLFAGIVWEYAEVQAQELEALSERDPLTGLANRRLLDARLAYELGQHVRSERELSVIVLDLNGFKTVNDTLGHGAGDELLRDVAAALAGAVRAQDTIARQGGDEFSVLAPETGPEAARELVTRIVTGLASVSAGDESLSAGIGCATFPDDGADPLTLIACADARQRADKPVRLGAR